MFNRFGIYTGDDLYCVANGLRFCYIPNLVAFYESKGRIYSKFDSLLIDFTLQRHRSGSSLSSIRLKCFINGQRRIQRRRTGRASSVWNCLRVLKFWQHKIYCNQHATIKTWIFFYTLTTKVLYVWRVHQNNLKTSKLYRAPRFINSWIRHWRRNPKVYVGLENDLYCILSILLPCRRMYFFWYFVFLIHFISFYWSMQCKPFKLLTWKLFFTNKKAYYKARYNSKIMHEIFINFKFYNNRICSISADSFSVMNRT